MAERIKNEKNLLIDYYSLKRIEKGQEEDGQEEDCGKKLNDILDSLEKLDYKKLTENTTVFSTACFEIKNVIEKEKEKALAKINTTKKEHTDCFNLIDTKNKTYANFIYGSALGIVLYRLKTNPFSSLSTIQKNLVGATTLIISLFLLSQLNKNLLLKFIKEIYDTNKKIFLYNYYIHHYDRDPQNNPSLIQSLFLTEDCIISQEVYKHTAKIILKNL